MGFKDDFSNTIRRVKPLLSDEHFSVDGTLIEAWASQKSFRPKDGSGDDWLDRQFNASAPVGLPWASVLAFLRLVTNPRVFESPEPIGEAWQRVRAWLAAEPAWVPQPRERRAGLLGKFLALPGVHGKLVPDAHRAALAVSADACCWNPQSDPQVVSGLL